MINATEKRLILRKSGNCLLDLIQVCGPKGYAIGWLQDFCGSGASFLSSAKMRKGDILALRWKGSDLTSKYTKDLVCNCIPFQNITSEVVYCEENNEDFFKFKIGVKFVVIY